MSFGPWQVLPRQHTEYSMKTINQINKSQKRIYLERLKSKTKAYLFCTNVEYDD